jgi:hypothetical protein
MLKEQLRKDLNEEMKKRNETAVSTLRMLLSSISNKEIELKKKESGLGDEEIKAVIKTEIKKRRDSIEAFEKGGRKELAEKEKQELGVLSAYLPPELSDDEIAKIAETAIKETGATGVKEFGKAMSKAMSLAQGRAPGDKMSQAIKKILG